MSKLNEGPITAIGSAVGALSRLKNGLGKYKDASKMYLAYKKWAGAPARITDIAVVQDFAKRHGVPNEVIKASADEWKQRYSITPDEIKGSTNSSKRPDATSPISEKEITMFFRILHDNIRKEIAKERKVDFDGDSFDSDLANIIKEAEKYGLKADKIKKIVSTYEFSEIKTNNAALTQLALIGYIALRY